MQRLRYWLLWKLGGIPRELERPPAPQTNHNIKVVINMAGLKPPHAAMRSLEDADRKKRERIHQQAYEKILNDICGDN
jgi:hypothetical protein